AGAEGLSINNQADVTLRDPDEVDFTLRNSTTPSDADNSEATTADDDSDDVVFTVSAKTDKPTEPNVPDDKPFALEEPDLLALPGSLDPDDLFQGFRYEEIEIAEEDEFALGVNGEAETTEERPPILKLTPYYSGLVDPGTVLHIKIKGEFGESIANGEMTVVADAGGNWVAAFPDLVLTDQPHQIVIEQTRATWDMANDRHGYNLRTYFAPAISPTHIQSEVKDPSGAFGRIISPMSMETMRDAAGAPKGNSNTDWRLSEYEYYAQSGIGGVTQ
ncbi:MAG: hypothetical protein AAF226_16625, partial [Verrucomicrobiota bacterium]